jgi:protein arginine kinase
MHLNQLLNRPTAWLQREQPASIVVSTRVRLARNLTGWPFPSWAGEDECEKVWQRLHPVLANLQALRDCLSIGMSEVPKLEKAMLVERHLISREHSEKGRGSGLVVSADESVSIMVNEEDHLRLQIIHPGMTLLQAWQRIDALDSEIEGQVDYAFSTRLGYLTSCPSNVGTGMRASAMLHLPALALTDDINPVVKGLNKLGLAVRGMGGEGTEATGHFYQISNQITLGRHERGMVEELERILLELVAHETNARARLREKEEPLLRNHVGRAIGVLQNAWILTSKEALELLSGVRLGAEMGLVTGVNSLEIDELMLVSGPAHLQRAEGKRLKAKDRDILRATLVRTRLAAARVA